MHVKGSRNGMVFINTDEPNATPPPFVEQINLIDLTKELIAQNELPRVSKYALRRYTLVDSMF